MTAGRLSKDPAEQQWFNPPPKADSAFNLDDRHTGVVLISELVVLIDIDFAGHKAVLAEQIARHIAEMTTRASIDNHAE